MQVPLSQFQEGVLSSCLGCFIATFGVQLRISALAFCGREARIRELSGWSLWALGQGLGQVAIAIVPASMVACITFCGSLLSNAILAPVVLHEQLTLAHGLGVLLLSSGGSAVTTASNHQPEAYTFADFAVLAHRVPFLGTMAVCLIIAALLLANSFRLRTVGPWCFGYIFALCGAIDLLVTKCTLQVLTSCMGGHPTVSRLGGLGALGAAMICLHLATLGFSVASTSYGDALQNMPIFLGLGTLVQVVVCGTFFNEFGSFYLYRTLSFCSGFCLMLAGLAVTSYGSAVQHDSDDVRKQRQLVEELLPTLPVQDLPSLPPLITSGILERRLADVAHSADLLLFPEMQRSIICFNGKPQLPLHLRPVGSEPARLLKLQEAPPRLRQVATAPGGVVSKQQQDE